MNPSRILKIGTVLYFDHDVWSLNIRS